MRRALVLIIVVVAIIMIYFIFSNPARRNEFLSTIESSTGVDLESDSQNLIEDAGKTLSNAASQALKDLSATLSDPKLRQSIKDKSLDALRNLSERQLKDFNEDLERELQKEEGKFDEVLEKYLDNQDGA